MREILFKAKRIDDGEWVAGSLVKISENDFRIATKDDCACAYTSNGMFDGWMEEIHPNTICQYTGMTDKNGNKIWGNDIVCFNNAEKCVVRYRFGAFEFLHRACANAIYAYVGTDLYLDENTLDMEVIGNIFDNPDLIGE